MKKIKSNFHKVNLAILAMATTLFFASCEKEMYIKEPGNLVPKTVDQDPNVPSISVNGTLLHSEAFGNPNHPMVIYLHGGPGSDYRNALNVKQLVDNNYYVVFYDQRGSGLSRRHPRNSYTIQLMIDDLSGVIQHYRRTPDQKVFLFGHSWGAMLATAYVNQHPAQIAGLILAEPGGFTDEMVKEYGELSRELKLLSEAANNAVYLDQFLTGRENDNEILDYKLGLASSYTYSKNNSEGIEGPSPLWRKGAVLFSRFTEIAQNEGFDFTQNLHQYSTNVLFLYGELNTAYGLTQTKKMSRFFPNSTITEIEGTGHEMIYFKWHHVYTPVLNYLNSLK